MMKNKKQFTQELAKALRIRREKHIALDSNITVTITKTFGKKDKQVTIHNSKSNVVYLQTDGDYETVRKACVDMLAKYAGEEEYKNGHLEEQDFLNRYIRIARPVFKAFNSRYSKRFFAS